MPETLQDANLISRIIISIVMVIVIGLQAWQLNTTQDLTVKVASMETVIQERTFDRYTRSEAESDNALIVQRVGRLEQWNQNLSERIRQLEDDKSKR